MIHQLKTHPQYFKEVKFGKKNFEIRKNDREFKTGDLLELWEYIPEEGIYTQEVSIVTVEYILHGGKFGLEEGYCIMGISKI